MLAMIIDMNEYITIIKNSDNTDDNNNNDNNIL